MAAMMQRRLGAKLRTADDYATADEKEIKELSAMTGIKYKQPARRPQPKRIAAPASTLMNLNDLKQLAEEDGSPIKARKALPSPPETAELGEQRESQRRRAANRRHPAAAVAAAEGRRRRWAGVAAAALVGDAEASTTPLALAGACAPEAGAGEGGRAERRRARPGVEDLAQGQPPEPAPPRDVSQCLRRRLRRRLSVRILALRTIGVASLRRTRCATR